MKMKIKSKSVRKAKTDGSWQQVRATDEPDQPADSFDCPREQMVAEAAYFRAEQRNFMPGEELGDWLRAEAELSEKHEV
jgi:hypothetical protein